ncbi:HEAT repeat domain-containing protein [Prosthecobacter sp. SYSU 5D2]|uniref:HEAT repeat domain-containing protein n=1 Tax=Prosthecobacter sp. SYSU 5D2 TaxID=3134134 RepID=UPI0031FEC45B
MSSKIILLTTLVATIGVGLFFFVIAGPDAAVTAPKEIKAKTPKTAAVAGYGQSSNGSASNPVEFSPLSNSAPASSTQPAAEMTSNEIIMETIDDAAVSYDAKELPKIQPFLLHPDREVRKAALDGMVMLGDAAAAPLLRSAAKLAPSPEEAAAMNEAAAYVELPPGSLIGAKSAGPNGGNRAAGSVRRPPPGPYRPGIRQPNQAQ